MCLVGTVVVGTPHASVAASIPRHSPFHHLLSDVPTPTPEQSEWAEWTKVYVQTEETRPVLKNEAFFIDERGEMIGTYTKRNLWHPERSVNGDLSQLTAANTSRQGRMETVPSTPSGARQAC